MSGAQGEKDACKDHTQRNSAEYVCKTCKQIVRPLTTVSDVPIYEKQKCSAHPDYMLEFFCSTCYKYACTVCNSVLGCCQNKHDLVAMDKAVHEFNKNVTEVLNTSKNVTEKLEKMFDSISEDQGKLESNFKVCKAAIDIQEKELITKIMDRSKELKEELHLLQKKNLEAIESELRYLDSKKVEIGNLVASTKAMINKPENFENLLSHKKIIIDMKDNIIEAKTDHTQNDKNIVPYFIPSSLVEKMEKSIIGEITMVNELYKVTNDVVTVTEGKPFVVTVSSEAKHGDCKLEATLRKPPRAETTEIEYLDSGGYTIRGRCSSAGNWILDLTTGATPIKGSPVHITVKKDTSKVHTIDNILYFKNNKSGNVTDVKIDKNGHILVSSYCNCILKFSRSGSFIDKILVPADMQVIRMFLVGYDQLVYSEYTRRCIVRCDYKFRKIRSYGKGILKYPMGLVVNNDTNSMYVADRESHCVFKFNIDDGVVLGKIGSKGSLDGQMNMPSDVTVTKTGDVIVADFGNHRLQLFNPDGKFIHTFVGEGKEDGKVYAPSGLASDIDGNILVSSNHKLQLFDRRGAFIKRLDQKDDAMYTPLGLSVISNTPKRVAVANHGANNVKIFNY